MKKYRRIIIIICAAVAVSAVGIAGTLAVLRRTGAFSVKVVEDYEKRTYEFSATDVKSLFVEDVPCDIVIERTGTQKNITVTCFENDNVKYDMNTDADGVLSIIYKGDEPKQSAIFSTDRKVTVLLPDSLPGYIQAVGVSGSINADGVKTGGGITLSTVSGSVWLVSSECGGDADLSSTSGVVTLNSLTAGGRLKLSSVSGGISATDMKASSVAAETVSQNIKLTNVFTHGDITADTTSGDVVLTMIDASGIAVTCTSGDVDITAAGARGDYTLRVKSVTGSANVSSASGGAKSISVTTVSGNIRIYFTA